MTDDHESIGLRFDISALADDPLLKAARIETPLIQAPTDISETVRKAACQAWEDRTRSEYVGVMIVHHFHGLLVDLNAPMDIQEVALTMLKQEQEHAALCMAAARSLGSEAEVAFDLSELQLIRTSAPLENQLINMLIGTYAVGEVVAHRLLRHAIHALPDTPYQDILRRIFMDEMLHAHIGPAILKSLRKKAEPVWIRCPDDKTLMGSFGAYIKAMSMRDVIEEDEALLFENEQYAAELVRLGIPPSLPFRKAYLEAIMTDIPKAIMRCGIDVAEYPSVVDAIRTVQEEVETMAI